MGKLLNFEPGSALRLVLLASPIVASISLFDPLKDMLTAIGNIPPATSLLRVMAAVGLGPSPTKAVTIVDIDEDAWAAWRRPAITPRAELAKLIEAVARHGPAAIMLDVDLSRTDPANVELRRALENVLRAAPGRIPILVPREIEKEGTESSTRSTPFDDLEGLAWVSARFSTDDTGAVALFRRWEAVCKPIAMAVPSSPMFLSLTLSDPEWNSRPRWARHHEAAAAICGEKARPPQDLLTSARPSRLTFVFGDVKETVLFEPSIARGAIRIPVLYRLTARSVLDKPLASEAFRDRVVIIGASHSDSGDLHPTPYGTMPGMMILANAIAMGRADHGELGLLGKTGIAVSLAVISGLIFQRLRFVFFFLSVCVLSMFAHGLISAVWGPSTATEILASSLGVLGALLGLESIWETAEAIRRGQGFRSILRGGGT